MKITDLYDKSILVLGFGVEGISTFEFLRESLPKQRIGIADKRDISAISQNEWETIISNANYKIKLSYNFGRDYLSFCDRYDVIVKSPGIRADLPEIEKAKQRGAIITSHTELFLENCRNKVIGVTGTKGKGTTSKLIFQMLIEAGFDAHLVGNIGNPPLNLLENANKDSIFVFEMSSQQLENLHISPQISVCLKIVPDHLDFHGSFQKYVSSKTNITLNQKETDYFVFNSDFDILKNLADQTKAQLFPFSVNSHNAKCYIKNNKIYFIGQNKEEEYIIDVEEALKYVEGNFNLHNILPAVTVAKILDIPSTKIVEGIKNFEPLKNRFERIGTFKEITFYNASISTVPEVTIEHITSLGNRVETVLLGGFDRGIDFSSLGTFLMQNEIKNLILFPTTGEKIWNAVRKSHKNLGGVLPNSVFIKSTNGIDAMKEAVAIAYQITSKGKICLHSPASPSFGLFKDFTERGNLFKTFVVDFGKEAD